MDIEMLISTMDLKNHEALITKMNIKKSIVINQTSNIQIDDIKNGKHRLYSYDEKGLSKSRNKAIKHSNSDICVIADDDLEYEDDYQKIIEDGYKKYSDADMIAFYVDNVDENRRRPKQLEGKINFIKSMKIQSVQITFKRQSIIDKNIKFNERFGAGAELYMGEENIFLTECLRSGLKIYYIPEKIATIKNNDSSWFKGHNEYNFNVKGAVYYEMSKWLYPLLILQFAIRKTKLYANEVKPMNAIKYMFQGIKKYRKSIQKKIYYMGDFVSNTGPAMVNKNYYPYMKDQCYICKTNNKIKRICHFISHIIKCNTILISGLSKFHVQAAKIAKKINKKVIYLMHGYDNLEYELNEVPENERYLKKPEEEMLQIADEIICVSERFCEYMKNERIDIKEKFDFVNNGIEEYEIENKPKAQTDIFNIISIGGGISLKNNLNVCKAIEEIKDIKIKFIVIGYKSKYGDDIQKYDFVEYYEKLEHNEVIQKMKESDLYIQNSSYETFGLAICEAVFCGCEILVSKNVGAISVLDGLKDENIIQDINNISEIKEKIIYLCKNEKNTKYISNIKEITWEKSSEKLKDKVQKNEG